MFYFERDTLASDIQCPNCYTDFDINWDTEYGDPLDGQYDIECPECGYECTLTVTTRTTYNIISR